MRAFIRNTPVRSRAHSRFSTPVFTRRRVENINWRQSISTSSSADSPPPPLLCGAWKRAEASESWLSSQEVLFLAALRKHWKRDPELKKKIRAEKETSPRLSLSTVNKLACTIVHNPPHTHTHTSPPTPPYPLPPPTFLCVCLWRWTEQRTNTPPV